MSHDEGARAHRHTHIILVLLTVIATLVAVYVWQHPRQTVAQVTTPTTNLSALPDFTAVAERVIPAVVNITTNRKIKITNPFPDFFDDDFFGPFFREGSPFRRQERTPREFEQEIPATGSGFIFRPDGYILTNNHVIQDADEINVKLESGKEYKGVVKGRDPRTELAVIKIDAGNNLPTLPLGDSDAVRVGQWVLAVGSPFEYQSTVTAGIVSAKGRSLMAETGPYALLDLIQTDAAINPGNSGGPLVNLNGEVVGIDVAIAGPGRWNVGIGFAVPINSAKAVLEDLIAGRKIVRGWLGVSIQNLTEELRQQTKTDEGVFVREVQEDSPAEKAGVEPGDVITEFNGQKLTSADQLSKLAAATKPGTVVPLTVRREGETKTLRVKVGKMPDRYAGYTKPEAEKAEAEAEQTAMETLGLTVEDIDEQARETYKLPDIKGVVVTQVDPDGPAAAAGLEEGDVILKVGGKAISDVSDFQAAVKGLKGSVTMVVRHEEDGSVGKRVVEIELPE